MKTPTPRRRRAPVAPAPAAPGLQPRAREQLLLLIEGELGRGRRRRRVSLRLIARTDGSLVERHAHDGGRRGELDLGIAPRSGALQPLAAGKGRDNLWRRVLDRLELRQAGRTATTLSFRCTFSAPDTLGLTPAAGGRLPWRTFIFAGRLNGRLQAACLCRADTGAVLQVAALPSALLPATLIQAASLMGLLKTLALLALGYLIKSALALAVIPWLEVAVLILLLIALIAVIIMEVARAFGGGPLPPGAPPPPKGSPAWHYQRALQLKARAERLKAAIDAAGELGQDPTAAQLTETQQMLDEARDAMGELAEDIGDPETREALDKAKANLDEIAEKVEGAR